MLNRMTDEELRQFVADALANRIFSSGQLRPHEDPGMVFFPIKFGCLIPDLPEIPEPPETIPDDWTVEQFEEYPEKYEKLTAEHEAISKKLYEATLDQIGCFWEYMDKAMPRSINGLPCFMSVRIMHKDDWDRALKAILREQERMKELEV